MAAQHLSRDLVLSSSGFKPTSSNDEDEVEATKRQMFIENRSQIQAENQSK